MNVELDALFIIKLLVHSVQRNTNPIITRPHINDALIRDGKHANSIDKLSGKVKLAE